MTEIEENMNVGGMYSKFWRITLVIISMLLIFAGPTYVPYAMLQVNIDYIISVVVGLLLFIVCIVFMLFLMRKKIITL